MRVRRAVPILAGVVAGAALGAGIEAGGALLLYTGQGFLGAVGLLLGLAFAAVAAGVWVGGSGEDGPAPPTRGRWITAVVAFAAAAVFAQVWSAAPGMRQTALGRALAVLFLLAEPAYAGGSLLAVLRVRPGRATGGELTAGERTAQGGTIDTAGDSSEASTAGIAAAALAGTAVGVLAAALVLIPRFAPGAIYLGSAVALTIMAVWEGRGGGTARRRTEESMNEHVVLVTGVGGRGQVGYALAEAFLAAGWRVAVTDIPPETEARASELAERGEVVGVRADLTREDEARRVAETVRDRFGRMDALVNAAGGLTVIKPLAETTAEEWEREVAINAETAFLMSQAALPLLRESRGAVVNFASPAGLRAAGGLGAYSAGKAAVVALTRALAVEEKANGVRVNAIAPGMIDTEQNRASVADPASVRWVSREEVARVVVFLASDAASGVTGETIQVLGDGIE